jgi:predicted nucleotidyltransferase component of viral defense system
MILQSEIIRKAEETGVPPATLDKDWVLGHFIAELYKTAWANEFLIFKGGTCLKKCYFDNFRFSEDIDFTLINPDFEVTNKLLQLICDKITNRIGILFSKVKIEPLLWGDNHVGYTTHIRFWGANHKKSQLPPSSDRWQSSIKIEIVKYELMVNPPLSRPLMSDYSDFALFENIKIPCYSILEVVSEKLRALLQRSYPAPRDYYDLWYLFQQKELINWKTITTTFARKAEFKKVVFKDYTDFFESEQIRKVKQAWNNSLKSHLKEDSLPDVNRVIDELQEISKTISWQNNYRT